MFRVRPGMYWTNADIRVYTYILYVVFFFFYFNSLDSLETTAPVEKFSNDIEYSHISTDWSLVVTLKMEFFDLLNGSTIRKREEK